MKLKIITPKQSLNVAFRKQRPLRSEIERFKTNLLTLLGKVEAQESEENKKNNVRDFLLDTYYKGANEINTKDRKDLVIHLGKTSESNAGVILEAKNSDNLAEMLRQDRPNSKAFWELVLYYFDERIDKGNSELKQLIATNSHEWFIFDANTFDKHIYQNTKLKRLYETYKNDGKRNPFIYDEIRKNLETYNEEILCTWFNLREYEPVLKNDNLEDDKNLIAIFKILSPIHLLKTPFADDSNTLNKPFYTELLHLIGLEETKEKGKIVIRRKEEGKRNEGSLLENTIRILKTKNSLRRIEDISNYGETTEDRYFNVALELCITWINRILFLKLLESQLVAYHKESADYLFLNFKTIPEFDELFTLFHQVLAVDLKDREVGIREKYKRVPYLNSSLFEISELEDQTVTIESLKDTEKLPFTNSTVLKTLKAQGKMLNALEYLFRFLDAYDFASEGVEDIQEDTRTLINASVLGKVFEKINGYKDGSIFTPGFITMYMCRQAIRLAVIQKFKDKYAWNISEFSDLGNYLQDRRTAKDILEFNELINSLHLCDPAVGSGHFLVSSLNEILAIKSELGLFADAEGVRLSDYEITIENDELIITDEKGDIFEYHLHDGKPTAKAHKLQKTLFQEKQTIIENCLFGVDINSNSAKICRLRLWIELLKNAYYKEHTAFSELETLPNIDINIKTGNSLLSRFKLDEDLKEILKTFKYNIEDYRNLVLSYKETRDREKKREFEAKIQQIKTEFKTQLWFFSPERKKRREIKGELDKIQNQPKFFDESEEIKGEEQKKIKTLLDKLEQQDVLIKKIEENTNYRNAFEWRFEFPEVLDNKGNFIGFDLVIGNPPYIYRNYEYEGLKKYFTKNFESTEGNFDLYKFFIEKANSITSKGGFSSLIVPNTFLSAKTFNKLRNYIIRNSTVLELFDLGENVFEGITVENIIIQQKNVISSESQTDIKIKRSRSSSFDKVDRQYRLDLNRIFKNENAFNIYLDDVTEGLVDKIRRQTRKLGEVAYCTVGINTGYIKDELTAKKRIDITYHKMLSGRDIGVNSVDWKGDWIKYDKSFVESFGNLGRTLPPEYIFTQEKILVQRTRRGLKRKLVCYYDVEQYYNLNRLSNIVSTDKNFHLKYIHSLLNSSLLDYFFNVYFNEYEVKPLHLAQLPIKQISRDQQQPFIVLVDDILARKILRQETRDLENEIDKLVYQLYELTDEEITIVEQG